MTQKGQVVIPLAIREYFNLKPSSKLHFSIKNNMIVAEPVLSIDEAYGFIRSNKKHTKKDYKKAIEEEVIKKFQKKLRDNT